MIHLELSQLIHHKSHLVMFWVVKPEILRHHHHHEFKFRLIKVRFQLPLRINLKILTLLVTLPKRTMDQNLAI